MVLLLCNCKEEFTIQSPVFVIQAGLEVKSPSLKLSLTCAGEVRTENNTQVIQRRKILFINSLIAPMINVAIIQDNQKKSPIQNQDFTIHTLQLKDSYQKLLQLLLYNFIHHRRVKQGCSVSNIF